MANPVDGPFVAASNLNIQSPQKPTFFINVGFFYFPLLKHLQ